MIMITECPPTEDGFERFACPTPDKEGRYRCIEDHVLCDGYIDCPNGDDEDMKNCFFFKTVSTEPFIYNKYNKLCLLTIYLYKHNFYSNIYKYNIIKL